MMKRMLRWFGWWVLLVSRVAAQDAAVVVAVEGKAMAMSAGVQREVKAEERLAAGAFVSTERNSKIVLALADGVTVQLGAEGEVFLESEPKAEKAGRGARLSVLRGEIVGTVPARGAGPGEFEVVTAVGAVTPAGAEGGVFRLRFGPTTPGTLRFVLAAAKGEWVLTAEGGQRKKVEAGRELAFDVQIRPRE